MPTLLELMTGRYTEQVTWRDAATGRLLAESDFFEPLSPNRLITPGYGGRVYFPTSKGFITLQVRQAASTDWTSCRPVDGVSIGGAELTVWAAVVEGAPVITWRPRFVAVLAFLSLVGTAAAFVAWFTETMACRLDALSAWTFLVPVIGITLAALVLGERPTRWTAVGLALVLVSLWVVLRPRNELVRSTTHDAQGSAR